MGYKIVIKNNETHEERVYDMDIDWDGESSLWWWDEGNFGCDCNRADVFARAGGEDDPESPECGHERFTVLWAELPDGTVIDIDE